MAGYSGKPQPDDLQEDSRARLCGAPDGFARLPGVVPLPRGEADVIVLFARVDR